MEAPGILYLVLDLVSFTDAQKDNKIELALSLFTRGMQELRGGRREHPPASVVLWPPFETFAEAQPELERLSWYLGDHKAALRYAVSDSGTPPKDWSGAKVPIVDLRGLWGHRDTLVLLWKYEGLGELPIRALHRTRIVDSSFHDKCEALTAARLMRWDFATSTDSEQLRRLSSQRLVAFERWSNGPSVVFGTGPGLDLFDKERVDHYGVRVGCNSMVLSEAVLERTAPNVVCFGDPVFHFGYSDQAEQFRKALLGYVERANPWVFLPMAFGGWIDELILSNERIIPLELKRRGPFNPPTSHRPWTRNTGNVMTELMVPVAASASTHISVFGCDGRPPSSDRFWDYGNGVHDESSYQTAVSAHPSFFRDRRYVRYYEEHCENLERLLGQLEAVGVRIVNRSPSQIPALQSRSELDLSAVVRLDQGLSGVEESLK